MRGTSVFRRPSTWLLTGAFAGQAYAYYGLTAWLPTVLADEQGMSRGAAGAASSIFQVAALVGAFGAPVIINRLGGPLVSFLVNGVLWAALPLGLLLAPDLWAVWSARQRGRAGRRFRHDLHRRRLAGPDPAGEPAALLDRADRRLLCRRARVRSCSAPCTTATGGWTASLLTAFAGTLVLMLLGARRPGRRPPDHPLTSARVTQSSCSNAPVTRRLIKRQHQVGGGRRSARRWPPPAAPSPPRHPGRVASMSYSRPATA